MAKVTLQVLDGVDRGCIFRDLTTPFTVGREEGNSVQLNDERVSRFHLKIQEDQGEIVVTDLDSTNGTRVNGEPVQLSLLRIGDRIAIGRTLLLVGSPEEIDREIVGNTLATTEQMSQGGEARSDIQPATARVEQEQRGESELGFEVVEADESVPLPPVPRRSTPPELPKNLSPAQAAQLSELLIFLHRQLAQAVYSVSQPEADGSVRVSPAAWQRILQVQMQLAQYLRLVGEPDD
jgi:hypothetical protein